MKFSETPLSGAYEVAIDPLEDERGHFARVWCCREFRAHGLSTSIAQINMSRNRRRGTLRGMHWQVPPFSECKLVKCTRGAIFDVIIDLRPWSDTFKAWHGTELTELNYRMLLVPEGFAHGFLTLEEDTEVQYQVSQFYAPEFERGLKFDDPEFNIEWPLPVSTISRKDASWAPVSEVTWREMLGAASGGAR